MRWNTNAQIGQIYVNTEDNQNIPLTTVVYTIISAVTKYIRSKKIL